MKKLIITICVLGLSQLCYSQNLQKTKSLEAIKVGNQIWSTQNIDIDIAESWDYLNIPSNALIYGKLYSYEAAKKVEKLYKGWRLPTKEDFQNLQKYLIETYGESEVRNSILVGGETNLNLSLSGTYDEKGVEYLIGRTNFYGLGRDGHYWLADGFYACLNYPDFIDLTTSENSGCSIRLIKE